MRDYGVAYKSAPFMCDTSSAICLAHNLAKHIKVRHHFLRDHVEKGDIEMKFIDTESQLADILIFLLCVGSLVFVIPMAWFEWELVICLVYLYLFAFLLHFLHTHLIHFASLAILACICLIVIITVLG
jgi:hypothetical protein